MSYYVSVVCQNCGWAGLVEIKDGELVETAECPTCRCSKLTKRFGVSGWREEEVSSE